MSQYPAYTIPNGTITCVAAGCKDMSIKYDEDELPRARPAIVGSDLCEVHVHRMAAALGDLVGLHQVVERAVLRRPSARDDSGKVQTSAVRDIGDRWNPTAAHVLARLNDWTAFVSRTVLRDRPLTADRSREFDRTKVAFVAGEKTVTRSTDLQVIQTYSHGMTVDDHPRLQLAALAMHHARWLALYPTLGPALLDDVLALRRMALTVDDAPSFRRVALPGRYCVHLEHDTEFGPVYCYGQLVGIVRQKADPKGSEILCSNDPAHRIPREEWMAHAG